MPLLIARLLLAPSLLPSVLVSPALAGEHVETVGAADDSANANGDCYFDYITVTKSVTLLLMEVDASETESGSTSLGMYYYVYSGGRWVQTTLDSDVTVNGTADNLDDSHDLNYTLTVGTQYAIGWCTNYDVYAYYTTASSGSNDLSWATYDGWAYHTGGPTEVGDGPYMRFTVEASDGDGDGFDSIDDCDDSDRAIHPGADEIYYDGVDEACDEGDDYDADGDGYTSDAWSGDDCDDSDADVHPGAGDAVYDGVDSDCAGDSDYDSDGDGEDSDAYGGTDCADSNKDINTEAEEEWYDGTDQDCDGWSDYDQDMDGHDAEAAGGDDCDDTNPAIYTGCDPGTGDTGSGADAAGTGSDGTDDGNGCGGSGKGCCIGGSSLMLWSLTRMLRGRRAAAGGRL